MRINNLPLGPLVSAAVLTAGAITLWGSLNLPLVGTGPWLQGVLLAVILAAWLSFALDLLFRLQRIQRPREMLRLPEAFGPGTTNGLLIARRLLKVAAWSALLIGALIALADTRAEPGVYAGLILVIGFALGIWAIVWAASIPFPAIGMAFGFPWIRLLILGAVYVLLQQQWFVTYGFPGSPLWPALALGLGFGYLRRALISVTGVSHNWESARWARWLLSDERIVFPTALLSAAAVAIPVWGVLSVLPNINAILLSQRPDLAIGESSMPTLSQLFEIRQLVALLVLAVVFARNLPAPTEEEPGPAYFPILKAAAYGLSGYATWLAAAEFAPLGHGFLLAGSAIAGGLFALSAALVLHALIPASAGVVRTTATWLSQSRFRAFFMGTTLVLYALLLRPLFYEIMWFAPVYEWLALLSFAVFAINRMRKGVREELAPEGAQPAAWTNWSRHGQISEQRRDPRMGGLLAMQQRYIDTGELGPVWGYMLGLMLQNQVPLAAIPPVFEPLRLRWQTPGGSRRWFRRRKTVKDLREEAILEAMTRAAAVLGSAKVAPETVDEAQVRDVGSKFIEEGAGPEELAVLLSAAYAQKGAAVGQASMLWFPLLTLSDDATGRGGLFRALRRLMISSDASPRWDRARRRHIVDAAASHLFSDGSLEDLPMTVLSRQIRVSLSRTDDLFYRLPRGSAVEILTETDDQTRLRPAEGLQSFLAPDSVPREPILPTDRSAMERISA